MARIKTIFIGTPDIGLQALQALVNDDFFEVVAAISQPDKPVGRKKIIAPTPVKALATKLGISMLQPDKIISIIDQLHEIKPDLIVVIAYAQIIPKEILALPKYGCINIHASLLPKYRGASVLQAPILNGDAETGITIMKMDEHLDTGPILSQAKIKLESLETPISLSTKLAPLGAELLIPTLKQYIHGELRPRPQDDTLASYVKILSKNDGRIDWHKSAQNIERQVRAMTPWPGTWTTWNDQLLKIIEVEPEPHRIETYPIGQVFIDHNKLAIQTEIDALIIRQLQLEGKKPMTAEEFLRGNPEIVHSILT